MEGHKVKDTRAVIDNDGNYGYFGSLGDLVKGRIREIDGKKYYFDEEGILYVDKTNKNIKTIDGVDYIANANGELRLSTEQETTTVPFANACIDEVTDVWMEDVREVVDGYDTLPRSVSFTTAALGTVKKNSIVINLSGTIRPKSGSSKTIKYKITYDREEVNADIARTSTN